jgi:MSHA biogenesis protein MshQ
MTNVLTKKNYLKPTANSLHFAQIHLLIGLLFLLFSHSVMSAGDGLKASYWNFDVSGNGGNFPISAPTLTQVDPTVDFDWGTNAPVIGINPDQFAVRWEGELLASESGNHIFHTFSDDGVRLWVNDQLVINNWTNHGTTLNSSSAISLTAGQRYNIKMEYYESAGSAVAKLHWQTPSNSTTRVIPQSQLFSKIDPKTLSVNTTPPCSANSNEILVVFNTAMKTGVAADSAENPINYTLSPDISITSIQAIDVQARHFLITLSEPIRAGINYQLTIENIVSADNLPLTPTPQEHLININNTGSGLYAEYWNYSVVDNGYTFPTSSPDLMQIDASIDFNWAQTAPNTAINPNYFAVRWQGSVTFPSSGTYQFSTLTDDGVRLWIDDVLVIDNWTLHSATYNDSALISFNAGQHVNIRMEYFENATDAVAQLFWITPGTNNRVHIPSVALSPCPVDVDPIALYHFDEHNWTGALNEVIDSSGNNYHGTTVNNLLSSFTSPALVGNPGSCAYAQFDGVDDYIAITDPFDTLKGTASLSFWIRTTQVGSNTIWVAPGITGVEERGGTDDIFWGWISEDGQIGITAKSNDNTSKSTIPINDGQWHHIVLTRHADTGNYQIFIDGNLNKSGVTGTGIVTRNFSSIGRIQDSYSLLNFQGDLDEVKVFPSVLSSEQVQSLMAQTQICPDYTTENQSCTSDFPSDIALFAGDQLISYNPITVNGQSIAPGPYSPSVLIDIDGQLQTNYTPNLPALSPATFPSNTSTSSIYSNGDISINAASEVFYNDVITNYDNATITFTGTNPVHIDDLVTHGANSTINFSAGTYYINSLTINNINTIINITDGPVYLHIGNRMTLHGSDIKINTNGSVDDLIVNLHNFARFTSNQFGLEFTGVIYGPNASDATFNGANTRINGPLIINPKRIYLNQSGFELNYSSTDKLKLDALFGDCETSTLDHFQVSYSSGGLSCLPSEITIKACENSNCSRFYTQSVDVTMSEIGTWSSNPISLTGGINTDLTFQASAGGDSTMAISASSVIATNPIQCYEDGILDTECTLTVSNAGFVFDIPTQTACKTSADITLRAIQTDDETNQCIGALTGSQTVNFFSTYSSPSSGTLPVNISGRDIDSASPGTGVSLTFDENGEATFTAQYDDAGEIRIDAEFDNGNGLTLSGNASFVSTPAALYVYSDEANATCSSADAGCSLFKKAGENFNLSVKAACWQSDTDNDYSDNPITPNFALDSITVFSNLVAPVSGDNASLSTTSIDFTSSDAGVHTMQQTVSDVGVFRFTVSPPSYLGESIPVTASDDIGRFYPDHLSVTAQNDGAFGNHSCGTFTYTGQTFAYRVNPSLTVAAYSANNEIINNYTGSFAKLNTSDFSVTPPTSDAVALGADNATLVSLNWMPDNATLTDNNDGSHTFSFGNDSYQYIKSSNNLVGPFTNAVNLNFTSITDSDGVQTESLPVSLQPAGEVIRFGQLAMSNTHGSELSPLPLTVYTQYFDGINWQINSADQCTAMTLANHVQLRNTSTSGNSWQAGTTTMVVGEGSSSASMNNMTNGQALVTFSAPGEDNQGYIDIQSRFNGSFNWLLTDSDLDGLYDDEINGKASFGIFKGSDRIIFRREVY